MDNDNDDQHMSMCICKNKSLWKSCYWFFLVKVKYFHHVHLANENLQAAMKTRNVNYDFLKKNAQVQYCSTKGREKSQAHNNEKNNRKMYKNA